MRIRIALVAALLCFGGCTYMGRRGADFLDQFRISVGAGTTIGVRGSAAGLVDTGLMVGVKPNLSAIGWRYGRGFLANAQDSRFYADQAEIVKATHVRNLRYGTGDYDHARNSVAVLPAVLTWTDATPKGFDWKVPESGNTFKESHWIWSKEAIRNDRYAQIHAFDFEIDIALGVYFEAGYSPGETLDFLLGIFGIDIAKDDHRIGGKK
ncbi:MAG: hypothetical protein ACYTHK_06280 [Planctomycetota bacterium]|jgi:hypothetical protein